MMLTPRNIWSRVCSLWRRREVNREIDEELRFHLEQRTAENLTAGMSVEEAEREARRRFGNLQEIRESCREVRGANLGETVLQDLRFGARMLRKNPGFAAVAVLSLAVGIGANTTVFCWVQNILLRPFAGVARQEELVVVTTMHGMTMWDALSLPDLQDQAKLDQVFAGVTGFAPNRSDLTADGQSEWIYGQITAANFFNVLGVKPLLGRTFLPEDGEQPGAHPVMVISEAFWKKRFGADPAIIGRTVEINRQGITIIGVAPGPFRGTLTGLNGDFWAPLSMCQVFGNRNYGALDTRSDRWVHTQARLRPGVSAARAQAALDLLAAQLERAYPDSNREIRFRVLPLWKSPFGAQPLMLPALSLLQAVSLGVLLIVAVNVANLLLARASRREKEIAIRLALGAGRGRLLRQLLTESLLLSLLGGAFGVLLAHWLVGLIEHFIPKNNLPIGFSLGIDWRILGLTLVLALATGVVFGLMPAWQASRPRLSEALKGGGRGATSGTPHHRVLRSLVVSQIALALVLLVCAGLCLKGLHQARHIDLGFDPNHVLYVGFNIEMNGDTETRMSFCQELQQRLASWPGVRGVALANWYPLGMDPAVSTWGVDVEGYPRQPNEDLDVHWSSICPGYFAGMQIPLFDGRDFTERDDGRTPPVAIINEAMAKRFWPGQNPVGRKFRAAGATRTVVGIAKTGKYLSLGEPTRCFFYIPFRQWPYSHLVGLCLRTTGDPAAMIHTVREGIQKLNPGAKPWAAMPMTDYIQSAFMTQQIVSSLLVLLGLAALALAAMGVYGVMAYVVSQRTHEFGVRLALGARMPDVLRLVLRQGLVLAAIGIVTGLALALAVTRLLANFLYGVDPFDAMVFAGVPLLLCGICLLACWLPARRAVRVDPMVALRTE